MHALFGRLVDRLRTNFWLVPALLVIAAFALSLAMLWIDRNHGDAIPIDAWWLFGGDDQGAREVLSAIAGSMITVTSVVFSITLLTLTLASGQFGSRILQSFMRDTGTQIVLGAFLATFTYGLLVLRTVREDFVPHLSVSVAMVLVFTSVGVLIYFIHHVATKIQAETIVATVYRELIEAIDRLFPARDDAAQPTTIELPVGFDEQAVRVNAPRSDYLQDIDHEGLLKCCVEHDLVVRLLYRPGDFVTHGGAMLCAWPAANVDDAVCDALVDTFKLDAQRTLTQDAEHGIHQLVEVAMRALSTGINDSYTAINCIDRLGAALCRVAAKAFPATQRTDDAGKLRVVCKGTSFMGFVDAAFNAIRQNAESNPVVLIRVMEVLGRVAELAVDDEQRAAARVHANLVLAAGQRGFSEPHDIETLEQRYSRVMAPLGGPAP